MNGDSLTELAFGSRARDFWKFIVTLERGEPRTRYFVYSLLVFVFYGGPGLVAAMVGFIKGQRVLGEPAPLRTILVGPETTIFDLFLHNSAIITTILFGFVTLGVVSILVLMLNGVFVGYGAGYFAGAYGFLLSTVAVAPHGIFEVPALWVAGIGSVRAVHALALFSSSARGHLNLTPWDIVATRRKMFEFLVLLILPYMLAFIAAVIEVLVTPWLVSVVAN